MTAAAPEDKALLTHSHTASGMSPCVPFVDAACTVQTASEQAAFCSRVPGQGCLGSFGSSYKILIASDTRAAAILAKKATTPAAAGVKTWAGAGGAGPFAAAELRWGPEAAEIGGVAVPAGTHFWLERDATLSKASVLLQEKRGSRYNKVPSKTLLRFLHLFHAQKCRPYSSEPANLCNRLTVASNQHSSMDRAVRI